MFIEDNQQDKVVTKKMYNPVFDEEDIPMVTKKEIMMNTGHRIQAGLMRHHFTVPDATEAASTLCLRQKLKPHKIVSLCRYLGVTDDPDLADLDQLMIRKNLKTGNIELLFLDGNKRWQSLTNK